MLLTFFGSLSPTSPLLLRRCKSLAKCKLWVISCVSVGKMPAAAAIMILDDSVLKESGALQQHPYFLFIKKKCFSFFIILKNEKHFKK